MEAKFKFDRPFEVGCRRPYIAACIRPEHKARNANYISFGEPTGGNGWPADGVAGLSDEQFDYLAHLFAASSAYAKAWSLVPDEIKQRIFDALHKPDTEWVEAAIRDVDSRSTPAGGRDE